MTFLEMLNQNRTKQTGRRLNYPVFALLLGVLASCGPADAGGDDLIFCPPDEEPIVRSALNLGSISDITMSDLKELLNASNLQFETQTRDINPRKCDQVIDVLNPQAIMVYLGKDETESVARNYLVVANEAGDVRVIEARHAYRAPQLE